MEQGHHKGPSSFRVSGGVCGFCKVMPPLWEAKRGHLLTVGAVLRYGSGQLAPGSIWPSMLSICEETMPEGEGLA